MNKYEYIVPHHLNSINHHSGWKGCVPFLDETIWFSLVCRVHRGFTLTLCSATLAKWCTVLCCWKHRQSERYSSFHCILIRYCLHQCIHFQQWCQPIFRWLVLETQRYRVNIFTWTLEMALISGTGIYLLLVSQMLW